MRYRIQLIVALITLIGVVSTALIYVERDMAEEFRSKSLEGSMPLRPETPQTRSLGNAEQSTMFDPVSPSTLLPVWEQENRYLMHANSLRFGHGPELSEQVVTALEKKEKITVVAAGDSYVWGQGSEDAASRWHQILEHDLNSRGGETFDVVPVTRLASSTMDIADWLSEERLSKLKTDAIVIMFGVNDYNPSYHESWICREFNTCIVDNQSPVSTNPLNRQLIECLKGDASPAGWFMRKFLNRYLPNVSRVLIERYCDPDRISAEMAIPQEGKVITDPVNSPYWEDFLKSLDRLKAAAGDRPIMIINSSASKRLDHNTGVSLVEFRKRGFEVITMNETIKLRESVSDDLLAVNPNDGHPSRLLSAAYARDVARALREHFNNGQSSSTVSENNPVLSNFLPVQLRVSEPNPLRMVVANDGGEVRNARWSLVPSGLYQATPCARMGRPHARVMFDQEVASSKVSNIGMKIESASQALVMVPVLFTEEGSESYGLPFTTKLGEHRSLPKGTAGVLIGVTKAGCPTNKNIDLPLFRISFERIS